MFEKSRSLIHEASQYLSGGVSSNFRLNIAPTPLVFTHGEGPFLYDVDGNRLIDYYLGMGPIILGHDDEDVIHAVIDQVGKGFLFAGQTEIEYEAANLICELVPCAERVRFGSSGTEVIQAAIRLARAATGRSTIIKFEGHYHGWLDNVLWSVAPSLDQAGTESAPTPVPHSAGQDVIAGQNLEVLPWNNLELVKQRLSNRDVAAIIMEPIMCNTSAILPDDGYLEGVRKVCNETGTVLIFDEVITGFRVALGGAQARLSITPDLATFGKAIANGFPVSCLAGRADLMDMLVTHGVMHGGTYNAQPVCMAATVATLRKLATENVHQTLENRGKRMMDGIASQFRQAGIEARLQGYPQVFHVAFDTSSPIRNYRDSLRSNKTKYVQFTTALLLHGVRALERGTWFLSLAHTDEIIDKTIDSVGNALKELEQAD